MAITSIAIWKTVRLQQISGYQNSNKYYLLYFQLLRERYCYCVYLSLKDGIAISFAGSESQVLVYRCHFSFSSISSVKCSFRIHLFSNKD